MTTDTAGKPSGAAPRLNSEIHPVPPSRRVVRSEALFGDGDSLLIEHRHRFYLLRRLPSGRLILTGWRSPFSQSPTTKRQP